jgi:hypothetical protein
MRRWPILPRRRQLMNIGGHHPHGTTFPQWKTQTIIKHFGIPTSKMAELRLSPFVIMIVFDSSTPMLVRKPELLALFWSCCEAGRPPTEVWWCLEDAR